MLEILRSGGGTAKENLIWMSDCRVLNTFAPALIPLRNVSSPCLFF